jgi:pimeloyl-ACP methyl ester carboxylesterase
MFLLILAVSLAVLVLASSVILFRRKLRQHSIAARLRIAGVNGIVDERYISLGGIDQWISIRGEDRSNPVLLILHGGPGASCRIFTPILRPWEKHFTVVQWDQRGSGKTLCRTGKQATGPLTLDRLAQDGIELAESIQRQLPASPIVLLGQSFGSTFALSMLKRRPDLFAAYVGTDQNIGMVRHRDLVHEETLARLRAAGLRKGVAVLERIGPDPGCWSPPDFRAVAQLTMESDPAAARRIFALLKRSIWSAPGYTLADIKTYLAGMNFSLEHLLPDAVHFDAWSECTHFAMPFFIFQGEHDVLTLPCLAESYLNDLTAPIKAFSLIRNRGHFAPFLEPDQFLDELLRHVRPVLAERPDSHATFA